MRTTSTPLLALIVATLLAGLATLALGARADDDAARRVPLLPAYVQECGACHVAYAPRLLPASSWQRLMGQLKSHFGSDASLDAATTQQLTAWLTAHAGSGQRAEATRDGRITSSDWFVREHRKVSHLFGTAKVKTAADCAACHTQAAAGSYGEREIRLPR